MIDFSRHREVRDHAGVLRLSESPAEQDERDGAIPPFCEESLYLLK
jgi:hypothetical protein